MKNLLIYINPVQKKFDKERDDLTKLQIDNSLDLGWNPKDILLVTNFPYEYKRIKALVVDDYTVFDQDRSTKIPAINELFERNLIEENEIYWFHDHDAFQLIPFEVSLNADAGFTNHGFSKLWNAGSFFFKKSARDIFLNIWKYMNLRGTNEQNALTYMWENDADGINDRYELMSNAYNLGIYHIDQNLKKAGIPAKIAHFHPHKKRHFDLFRNMLPKRLLEIFYKYGIY